MINDSFTDFLSFTNAQEQVSLAIAQDEIELLEFQADLEINGFMKAISVHELLQWIIQPSKIYYVIPKELPKVIYDFLVQYQYGRIQVYDEKTSEERFIKPAYSDVSIIFLGTKDAIAAIQNTGFRLLENTGITYQQ